MIIPLLGGGGGLYLGGGAWANILSFENTIFFQAIIFCSQSVFITNFLYFIISNGASFPGGLYMEGIFRFKSWFLNAPGLIQGGAYYRILLYIHWFTCFKRTEIHYKTQNISIKG